MGSGWPVDLEAKLGRSALFGTPNKTRPPLGESPRPRLAHHGEEKKHYCSLVVTEGTSRRGPA